MRVAVLAASLLAVVAAGCERDAKPPPSFGNESIEQLKTMHRVLDVFELGDDRVLVFREDENDYLVVFYRKRAGTFHPYGTQHHLVGVDRPTIRGGWVEARLRAHGVWTRVTAGGTVPSPFQEHGVSFGAPRTTSPNAPPPVSPPPAQPR